MPKSHWESSQLFTSAQLLCFDMAGEIRGYNKWSDDAMHTMFIGMQSNWDPIDRLTFIIIIIISTVIVDQLVVPRKAHQKC